MLVTNVQMVTQIRVTSWKDKQRNHKCQYTPEPVKQCLLFPQRMTDLSDNFTSLWGRYGSPFLATF